MSDTNATPPATDAPPVSQLPPVPGAPPAAPTPPVPEHHDERTAYLVIGVGLIVLGIIALGGPWARTAFEPLWRAVGQIRSIGWQLGLVVLGVLVIWWSRSSRFTPPTKGARLYRSRTKHVIAGVCGGLSDYFGVDVVLVRLAFVAFGLIFSGGPAIVLYIVAAVIVPEEPKTTAPAPPAPPVPPMPPAPPSGP